NAETYEENRFDKANKDLADTQIFTGRVMGLLSPLMMIIMNGWTLGIYWVGASLINKGTIDYATVTAFMMLASEVVMAFVMLIMLFVFLPRAEVSARRINEVLDTPDSIKDPLEEKPVLSHGQVEFKDVSFRYPGGKANVLEKISFKADKGQVIAFIGSTGSGKSTLVTLITRLFDASEGEVLVDGVNVKDLKQKTLRSLIGYVPQQGLLFSGTVKENIAFTNPTLSQEEVVKAAKIAEADEFISQMEGGYEAKISQGGKNVSGGQKQRLCIARALASKPEVLIFDDSFSALDYRTDAKLRANLKEYESGITKIIVAQRIGTIMDADEIFVLEDGKVVGTGKHEELLKTCPTYQEIALSQLSKEELGL
ncbi:MAG: ABC transporter ATP-binding protein/permease, partial [Bacilli bacterium]|nr:ABC transporter ATP-binding protein/permease [Bacilli bacterium]